MMSFAFIAIIVASGIIAVNCESGVKIRNEAVLYLQKYGYLDTNVQSLSIAGASAALKHAVSLFQEYYRLPGDGTLNNVTLWQMRKPRCGIKDILNHEFSSLSRKWPRTHLTWNFHLANDHILKTAEAAFALWAANSSLIFERETLNPDILISFRENIHTNLDQRRGRGDICPAPLDGPGGILAHASFPNGETNFVSEVHVDHAEKWYIYLSENPPDTMYLFQTLVHEIGHSLGLEHSTRNDSVMFAFAPDKSFPVKLSIEDILSIQNLYGTYNDDQFPRLPPETPMTTTTMTTTSMAPSKPENVDLCALRHVDAVLILNHRIFIAHQQYVWSININGRAYDRPLLPSDYMKFLPVNFTRVTAVYQRPSSDIVLFANNMVYLVKYPDFTLANGWPKTYSDVRLPPGSKINAVISTNKGQTFIIYDDYNVAELDECSMQCMKFNSLQAVFPGTPHGVTSAFRYIDGNIYFITRRNFYKFNEFTRTVAAAGKFDLQVIGIGCPRNSLLQQLQELLNRLVQYGNILTNTEEYEELEEK